MALRALFLAAVLAAVACGSSASEDDASSEDAVVAGHPAWLRGDARRRAEQLTSLFENGTVEIQYAYVEDIHDGRGFTSGRAGFTTATGDALDVVERYTRAKPNNVLAHYLPRLRVLAHAESGSTTGLAGYADAWKHAADDPVFRAAQDSAVDATYFTPAMQHADALGLATPLARAAVYDAIIQHGDGDDADGLGALLARAEKAVHGTPARDVDEKLWLDAFLTVRRADLAHANDPDTREAWAESVNRVDALRAIATAGNYELQGPIVIASGDFRGTVP